MDGVKATDNVDGDITSKVTTGKKPTAMETTPGKYSFTYTVTDKAGNTATKTRTITVIPDPLTAMPSTGLPINRWMPVMILAMTVGLALLISRRLSDH